MKNVTFFLPTNKELEIADSYVVFNPKCICGLIPYILFEVLSVLLLPEAAPFCQPSSLPLANREDSGAASTHERLGFTHG